VTTKSWFFNVDHTSDAGFRAWGSDLSAAFADVGLVKTADTGQINWTTVTRPAATTMAGYEVWRYPDSSIFVKFFFGTGTGAATPGVQFQVGTGSDGAGALTGPVTPTRNLYDNGSNMTGSNPRQSFMCLKDGFFGLLLYRFTSFTGTSPWGFVSICRTTDSSGVPDSRGFTVYRRVGSSSTPGVTAINRQTSTVLAENTAGDFVIVPMGITSSIIGVDTQCFLHWTALPLVLPNPYMATVIGAEVPAASTFSTTLVGTTPRTYLALDGLYTTITPTYRLVMLWE
jgi:hypothetical protein